MLITLLVLYATKGNFKKTIKRSKTIKNKYKGKRCFILGNAPTIKNIDIKLLKDEYVFVMSTFYNHPDYKSLNKSFFSCVQIPDSINDKDKLVLLKAIDKNTTTTKTFFLSLEQKKMIERNSLFKDKDIYYIATTFKKRSFDLSKITRRYLTNVIQTLEVAMYLGFTEIYLHSVNLNSLATDGKYRYFFDRTSLPVKDIAINGDSSSKDFFAEAQILNSLFKDFKEVKEYARENNHKVYITNKESLLRFFKYRAFNEV